MKCYWDKQVTFFPLRVEIRKKFKKTIIKRETKKGSWAQKSTDSLQETDTSVLFVLLKSTPAAKATELICPIYSMRSQSPTQPQHCQAWRWRRCFVRGIPMPKSSVKKENHQWQLTLSKHKAHFNGQLKCPEETDINHPHTHPQDSFVSTFEFFPWMLFGLLKLRSLK